jgi:hypothetical protein
LLALVDVTILLSVIELFLWWAAALTKPGRVIYILMAAPLALWILKRPVCGPVLRARDFGLSLTGWRFHCVVLTPVTIVLVGLCFYFVEGSSALIPHFFKRAVIYPLWALLQNILVLGFLWPRLKVLVKNTGLTAVLCGLIFGLLHWPNVPITIATTLLGVLFAAVYSKHQTVLIIALCHGFLGAGVDEVLDWNLRVGRRYQLKLEKRSLEKRSLESSKSE